MVEVEIGLGNVFEQLGLPNPEERLHKARLMNVINAVVKRRGLSQKDAAKAAGLDQADISRIQHGRGARYSTDLLLNILARLRTMSRCANSRAAERPRASERFKG
jgi:predicted XRE-type DNA-binding protein